MSRIRAAAIARLAAVEQAGDVLRANFTTARQWLQTLGATDQPSGAALSPPSSPRVSGVNRNGIQLRYNSFPINLLPTFKG